MKKLLFALPLLLGSACTSTDWATYPLSEHLTVQLPSTPRKVSPQERKGLPKAAAAILQQAQALISSDDYGVYSVAIMPVDSSAFSLPRDSLYSYGIQQMRSTYQGGLLKRTTFNTPAGSGAEVLLDVEVPNVGKRVLTGVRLLLVGHQSFAFSAVPYAETDSSIATAQRRRFFSSITVKP